MRPGKELQAQRQQIRSRLALAFQRRALEEGMTQAELSRRTGAASPTVNEWFKSEAIPDGVMLARIAEALDVNGHWLLTGEGPMARPGRGEEGLEEAFRAGANAVIGKLGQVVAQLHSDFSGETATQRGAKVLEQERHDAEAARKSPGRRGSARRQAS